jgi:hypothetical protein
MNTGKPQDTFDHTIGAGALQWSWWLDAKTTGIDGDGQADDGWTVALTVDDGPESAPTTTVVLGHSEIMSAARKIMAGNAGRFVSDATRVACRDLIFAADEADFDANTADELLQVAVLGEVVFG